MFLSGGTWFVFIAVPRDCQPPSCFLYTFLLFLSYVPLQTGSPWFVFIYVPFPYFNAKWKVAPGLFLYTFLCAPQARFVFYIRSFGFYHTFLGNVTGPDLFCYIRPFFRKYLFFI